MSNFKAQNMPHIKATLQSDHKIIYEDDKNFIIYNKRSNTYIAEGSTDVVIDKIKTLQMERLETSNKKIFEYFQTHGNFKYEQICLQCYHKPNKNKNNVKLNQPSLAEMTWISKTYGISIKDVMNMHKNKEIFVYRVNKQAVSYVGIHIDGSVGFLYTKPEFRKHGYATKIENELFKIKKSPIFSQILCDNKTSIAFHKKNNWIFNRYKIYWLFNKSF